MNPKDYPRMAATVTIDGRQVKFEQAYVCLVNLDSDRGKHIQISLPSGLQTTYRVGVVSEGSFDTETPIKYERWTHLARHG